MDKAFRQIVELSLNEICIIDCTSLKFLYANAAAIRNLEYSLAELTTMTPLDIKPKEIHAEVMKHIKTLEESNDPEAKIVIKGHHIRKSGSTYPVEITIQGIEYQNKPAYAAFILDISDKQEIHDQLNIVIESGDLGYVDWNFQTNVCTVNDRWLEMLGLQRSEFDGSASARDALFHPDDIESVRKTVTDSITSNYSIVHEFRMKHKSGKWILIQASGTVVEKDRNTNEPLRLTATYKDITHRRQVEIEREQFYQFFMISPDIMVATNADNTFVRVNPAMTTILGYAEHEILSRPVSDFVHPDDLNSTYEQLSLRRNKQSANNNENRFLCKDGSYRWLSWSSRVDKDKNADSNDIIYATARDVTEHKKLIDELFQKEQMYRSLVESSHDVVIQYDRDHRHTYANPSAQRLIAPKAKTFIGKTHSEMGFPEDLCKMWENSIEKAFVSGLPNTKIFETSEPNGLKIVDWRVFPELSKSGEVQAVISIARDITQVKKTEEEEQKMQKLNSLGVLAGGIAHDFNNILTILFGHITLANMDLSGNHPSRKALEKAEKALGRATFLTSQLLTFAKGGDPVKKDVSISQLIEDVTQFDLSGSKVKLIFKPNPELWLANIDPGQISQVFSNLTTNANQAMPKGGHLFIEIENIEISTKQLSSLAIGKYLKFTVRDEGCGIHPKDFKQIFDPYFSTKETGSGLGLATVHSIVNKHNGHISAESELNVGTTFTLYLPASEKQIEINAQPITPAIEKVNRTAKILIMDDEELIRTLAVQALKSKDYQVDEACDGQQAIDKYKQALTDKTPYDCLIMDLTIPGGLGGAEAIKEILSLDPAAKAIVSSGYAVDPIMANHHDYGFKDIISKPFTIKELRSTIENILNKN